MRFLVVLLLAASAVAAEEPTRLGALIRTYLREEHSVSRREDLLAEIRRLAGDDPARVAASIRAGEHRTYVAQPAFESAGEPPLFKGRDLRCDALGEAIERSAGRYAALHLPAGYDPDRAYPLVFDIGVKPRAPEAGVVVVVLDPRRLVALRSDDPRERAYEQAVVVERMVLGLIAHTMSIVRIDPDRVFLRGQGPFAELVWYVGFQNPDRFAGLFCGYGFWEGAEEQAVHSRLFSVRAVSTPGDGRLRRGMEEIRRFSRDHRLITLAYDRDDVRSKETLDQIFQERAAWQQRTTRNGAGVRQNLVCLRPLPLRCHWLRIVPKTRSRKEAELARMFVLRRQWPTAWKHRLLPQPATAQAEIDKDDGNLVRIETKNLVGFQIYVDPQLFDVTKPLRVSVDGKRPTAHVIDPDIGEMLDDYREHGDPRLLYVARLNFP